MSGCGIDAMLVLPKMSKFLSASGIVEVEKLES